MVNVRTLEALLKARGWNRAELARRVGVSRQAVSLWFRAQEAEPTPLVLTGVGSSDLGLVNQNLSQNIDLLVDRFSQWYLG